MTGPNTKKFRDEGLWLDKTSAQLLAEAIARHPTKIAVVADRADRDEVKRITYQELGELTDRAANSLRALGVRYADVVTVQLPNWWEFVVIAIACSKLGAVVNPVMPILRERELTYILNFCASKVFVIPQYYRGFNYLKMANEMRDTLPLLRHLIVVDSDEEDGFQNQLLSEQEVVPEARQITGKTLHPEDLCLLMFTSGTTGEPKGVMHHSNAVIACNKTLADRLALRNDDVILVSSPVGHMAGYVSLMMESIYLGATMVLQDIWSVQRGVALMTREATTFTTLPPAFLLDVCDAVGAGAPRPSSMRTILCAGAPIASALIERATCELGVIPCSLWGMTEALGATLTDPTSASRKSATSDGCPAAGMEICVVDQHRRRAAIGESGRLLVRGSQMFMGYYKRPIEDLFDDEGWFDSEDLAYMDEEGYVRISGRLKDVIIRGGENVPVTEIENILHTHPGVAAVAIVGFADPRLGERACAFVVPKDGTAIDLESIQKYLADSKVAKQFWPERLEKMTELPRTPSGKVQKFKLKEMAQVSVGSKK